jgi:starch-binding outer membrane protein, SusD/RagB family
MKLIKYLTIIIVIIYSAIGCSDDLLDKKPLDKVSSADVWESRGLIEAYLADVYAQIVPLYSWVSNTEDDWTDDLHTDFNRAVTQETFDKFYDAGWNQYGKIRLCNQAIEGMIETEALDEQEKTELIAEAKMLRGMVYFWLARRFGGVMKIEKVLTPSDSLKLPRASESEIYDFIVEDLTFAKNNMSDTKEKGRLNKAAAHAFLIRALLQAKRYDQVVAEGREFIETKGNYGYAIDPDFAGIFNDYNKGTNSPEVIFMRYGTKTGFSTMMDSPMQWRLPLSTGEGDIQGTINDYIPNLYGWAMYYPTQDIADAFLMIDEDGTAKNWWETTYWQNHKDDGELAVQNMYKNRDKRFYSSIIYDGSIYLGDTINIRPPYWAYRKQMDRKLHRAMTGYNIRKGMYNNVENWSWPPPAVDYHWPLIRLSEVYLNYAEGLIRTNKAADALPYINATRTVHGELPALTSTNNILEDYKRERRCELAFEMLRYWDLIRWAETESLNTVPELTGDPTYIDISGDGSTYCIMTVNGEYVSGDINHYNSLESKVYNFGANFPERVFTQKRFRFPVPHSEILENPNLTQNPGWE